MFAKHSSPRGLQALLRHAARGAVVLGAALALQLPAAAQAQDDFGGDDEEGAVAEAPSTGTPPQAAETHVVQPGDTLWDLCSKYLNSPWYWPKIWSYNPQLTNPHWIYPGNELRFYPSDENLPTQIASSREITAADEELDVPDTLDPEDLVTSVGSIRVGRTAPNSVWTSHIGYITKDAHARAGIIVNAESESYMLADYDRAYVEMKTPAKKGDQFAIYRPVREIEHPVTGEPFGYSVEIIGGLQVVDTSPKVATGLIAQAYRPIERGDYVGPWPDNFGTRIAPVPSSGEAKGYIVDTVGDVLGPIGEYSMVFIDRGRNHGVQRGNLFSVLDRGDGFTREVQGLPNEAVGELMVVDVQDAGATAIVTFALRELSVGDKIVMSAN